VGERERERESEEMLGWIADIEHATKEITTFPAGSGTPAGTAQRTKADAEAAEHSYHV
jgi:hypothetical protein